MFCLTKYEKETWKTSFLKKVYETERLILKRLDKSYAQFVIDYYLRDKLFLEEWESVKSEEFYIKQYQ